MLACVHQESKDAERSRSWNDRWEKFSVWNSQFGSRVIDDDYLAEGFVSNFDYLLMRWNAVYRTTHLHTFPGDVVSGLPSVSRSTAQHRFPKLQGGLGSETAATNSLCASQVEPSSDFSQARMVPTLASYTKRLLPGNILVKIEDDPSDDGAFRCRAAIPWKLIEPCRSIKKKCFSLPCAGTPGNTPTSA